MARGITESDVHTAADEIGRAGERPTVERIRAHLGTGSPNTVTRWLETWWQALGDRLQVQRAHLAVPDAPELVAALAGEWWGLALEHARAAALEALAADRSALQAEQQALQQERDGFVAEATALRGQVDAAAQAERLASTQATELQRLASRLEEQIEEIVKQRDAALARTVEADTARLATDLRIQALQDTARIERENLAQHVRAVEDRAHAEVDRARQETKEMEIRLTTAAKEHASLKKSLVEAAEQAKLMAADAARDAGVERARADALEAQLAKLQDLPAALEAAMRRSEIHPKKQKPGKKRAVRASGKQAAANGG